MSRVKDQLYERKLALVSLWLDEADYDELLDQAIESVSKVDWERLNLESRVSILTEAAKQVSEDFAELEHLGMDQEGDLYALLVKDLKHHLLRVEDRTAVKVGTDTAEIYAIAPEQLYHIVKDGGWADYARDVFERKDIDPDAVTLALEAMQEIIRKHGGAVFLTGADGTWDVTLHQSGEVPLEEMGFLPPYGTPEQREVHISSAAGAVSRRAAMKITATDVEAKKYGPEDVLPFWVVTDPRSPKDELYDIMFQATPRELFQIARGSLGFLDEDTVVFYTKEQEARRDAEVRLKIERGEW